MDILEAKELVVKAGKEVVKSGLIARTWGNISCRVSATQFVITPSGRAYEDLTPDDIVLVNIADCSYEGNIKPSSEKGIHASVYEMRPTINFVIHTHQTYASVVGAMGYDINSMTESAAEIIGPGVTIAAYGLPGTGKLKNGVRDALQRSPSKAVIMAHHGALCVGVDYDDAFTVAAELEKLSEQFIKDRFYTVTGNLAEDYCQLTAYYASLKKRAKEATMPAFEHFDSNRHGSTAILISKEDGREICINLDTEADTAVSEEEYTPSMDLHKAVYNNREDVNCIIHSDTPDVQAASAQSKVIKPLLDDFAQLIGVTLKTASFDPNSTLKSAKKVVKKLKGRNAVMLKDNGALCVAGDKYNAEAVEMVLEKGLKTAAATSVFPGTHPINPIESTLMRVIYKMKYSKQNETNK